MPNKYDHINNSRTEEECQEAYREWQGHYPTQFGAWLGSASHWVFREEMNNWCRFIDSLMPNFFPFSVLEGLGIAIVNLVYENNAQNHYNNWADKGDDIIDKFNGVVTDAQNRINSAISDAKTQIESQLINPLRTQAADLQNKINAANAQLGNINSAIDQAKRTLTDHGVRIEDLESRIQDKDFLAKLLKGELAGILP